MKSISLRQQMAAACIPAALALILWAGDLIDFFRPLWLLALLVLPLFPYWAVTGFAGLPRRVRNTSTAIRCVVATLIILSLADIQKVRKNRQLCVLFLLDRSASIPDSAIEEQLRYVNQAAEKKRRDDTAGILVFGRDASVEVTPQHQPHIERIYSSIDRGYTNIQQAIELAVAVFPESSRKKIVLLSDGNETMGNLRAAARYAATSRVQLDVLPIDYDYPHEVRLDTMRLPDEVKKAQPFELRLPIQSKEGGPAELHLFQDDRRIRQEQIQLNAGTTIYRTNVQVNQPGLHTFTARISAPRDTIPENNESSGCVYVAGSAKILLAGGVPEDTRYLAEICRNEGIEIQQTNAGGVPASLQKLEHYDAVILANIHADKLEAEQMETLTVGLRDLGIGLVMVGGEDSFGAGGYKGTPLEEALPVWMDLRRKKVTPKGALVLILHTCEFSNGNYWAKQITKKAIATINAQDDVGVLFYQGEGVKWLFPLQSAQNREAMYAWINRATPGDMPSFAPAFKKAWNALRASSATIKHLIVISDGDPSQPTNSVIRAMVRNKITVSTIAISPHSMRDVKILKNIARTTGGRYYFVKDPKNLPGIFIREARVVKRSLIFRQPIYPEIAVRTEPLAGIQGPLPQLDAYVGTTLKKRALAPLISSNENHDPILAHWRYGLGRSVAFTSDATANWAEQWLNWPDFPTFWSNIIHWAARERQQGDLKLHTELTGKKGSLIIEAINSKGQFINFLSFQARLVSPKNNVQILDVRQTAPGRYKADFQAKDVGVSILNLSAANPDKTPRGFLTAGVVVPYSPEYRHFSANHDLLRQAAQIGGGTLLSGDAKQDPVFQSSLPPGRSLQSIWQELTVAALLLFFFNAALRRVVITRRDLSDLLALLQARRPRSVPEPPPPSPIARLAKTARLQSPPPAQRPLTTAPDPKPEAPPLSEQDNQSSPTPEPIKEKKNKAPSNAAEPKSDTESDDAMSRLLAAKKRVRKNQRKP